MFLFILVDIDNVYVCFELGAFYATRISALVTFGSIGALGFFGMTVYGCCWSEAEFILHPCPCVSTSEV